jgi:hypothetical protein
MPKKDTFAFVIVTAVGVLAMYVLCIYRAVQFSEEFEI